MTYFVLGYVQSYDPTKAPRPEVLTGKVFSTERDAWAYATTVHDSYKAFVVAVVEGGWAERLAAEYDKVKQLEEGGL
jgi:hypothetical protein